MPLHAPIFHEAMGENPRVLWIIRCIKGKSLANQILTRVDRFLQLVDKYLTKRAVKIILSCKKMLENRISTEFSPE